MLDDFNDDNDNLTEEANPDTIDNFDSADQVEVIDDTVSIQDDDDNSPSTDLESQKSVKAEENNSISADLIRGHINTIILRALYERDKYGYEIINDIESKSHGQYTLKQPTLYSALKRLENQGYIKAYWKTDEVTLGGRRKYFRLTESGKAITEKNLSEWEYSRTIIDSLISDKSFDFAKPAPTPVDFSLLRDSVSRVPPLKGADKPQEEYNQPQPAQIDAQQIISQLQPQTTDSASFVQSIEYGQPVNKPVNEEKPAAQPIQSEQPTLNAPQTATQQDSTLNPPVSQADAAQDGANQNINPDSSASQPTAVRNTSIDSEEEAARRLTHENYLRLISEPVRPKPVNTEDTVPGYENINSDRLLYNNRPETERDYKNLIDGIFFKTIYHGSVQTEYHSRPAETPQQPHKRYSSSSSRLVERGASDGVSITPSNENSGSRAAKTTFNKGTTLLKSSAIIFVIMIIEAVLCFIFMKELEVSWVYPAVILGIGVLQFAIFGILALNGYGKHSLLPTSHGYIATSIIITIIIILIIAMLSFLLNMNTAVISDILKMLVIPAIISLNLTFFSIIFRLFIR